MGAGLSYQIAAHWKSKCDCPGGTRDAWGMGVDKIYKDARKYAIRALTSLVVGGVALSIACGDAPADAPTPVPAAAAVVPATATAVPPTATPPAPTATATAIPPTPTFASAAPEWLPTALPDTPTPTAIPPTATPAPPVATPPAPSIATQYTTHDNTRLAAPRFNHTAALLPDGRVILGGGSSGVGSSDFVNDKFITPIHATHFDIYDPAKGWSVISPAGADRAIFNASMVLMADGAVLAVGISGSETENDFSPAAAMLDPATQLWTPLPAPSVSSRDDFLLTLFLGNQVIANGPLLARLQDGRVIAVGDIQFSKDDGFAYLNDASETDIFDPRSGQWQPASDTNNISESSSLVALQNGGALLVHNAYADDDEIGAEIYDPVADEWNVVSGIRGTRGVQKAVVLSDGRILVASDIDTISEEESRIDIEFATQSLEGGDIINEGIPLSPVIPIIKAGIYDPATDAWTTTGYTSELDNAVLTLLPDGRVLASGGTVEFSMSSTTIYDPETNAWTTGPDMAEPRFSHTATALPDGRVLIAGGVTIHPDTGELYPTDTSEIITVP